MPELPEVEITARRIGEAVAGSRVESVLAPGINALKTFDPPLHALEGRSFTGVRRRGKLLFLELGDLVLLLHLMSAGRLQMHPKRASLKDRPRGCWSASPKVRSCACGSSGRASGRG